MGWWTPRGRAAPLATAFGGCLACLACLALALAGCRDEPQPADGSVPARLQEARTVPAPDTLPEAAREFLDADTARGEVLGAGVHYYYRWSRRDSVPPEGSATGAARAPGDSLVGADSLVGLARPPGDSLAGPGRAAGDSLAGLARAPEGSLADPGRRSPRGPWAVHLVSAALTRCELQLLVVPAATAEDDGGRRRETVTEMRPTESVVPIAGVNGDFFGEGGSPLGPEVARGVVRRASSRPAFVWTARGIPWIGSARRDGRVMVFGTDTVGRPEDAGRAADARRKVQVVGGYPELLDGGDRVGDLAVGARPGFADAPHPRTAVGWDSEQERLWLVVVDGRQSRSEGMTLPELTELLEGLGVDEALNLDGGGSSTLSLRDRTANRPSDRGGERPVANSLWLVEDPSGCPGA